jgi:hypothetical protein
MSLAYHKVRPERDIAAKESSSIMLPSLGRGFDSSALRKSCMEECLNMGRSLSQEEKVCLSACYHKGVPVSNRRRMVL